MSISSIVHGFEYGVKAPPHNAIDGLIQRKIEAAAREVAAARRESSNHQTRTPITDIGDYLIEAAQVWTSLTNSLTKGPHVEAAILETHEQSRIQTQVTDLRATTALDIEITKLRYVSSNHGSVCRVVEY